jgi:hypothetical protein
MRNLAPTAVLLALLATTAMSDDGVFEGSGGAIVLSRSDNVRMVAEEVVFDLTEANLIRVSCLFVVVNEGPDEQLLLGFPDYWPDPNDDSQRADGKSTLQDLRISVDGVPVETTAVPVSVAPDDIRAAFGGVVSYNCAHVWQCSFASGQARVLRTEYSHPYSAMSDGSSIINYVLRTGASWKGPIGQVVLRIKRGAMRIKCPWYPTEWVLAGDEYVWSARELEPDQDVGVAMADPLAFARHLVSNWRWHSTSSSGDGADGARGLLRESIRVGSPTPEFMVEVCSSLGDTVPDLRRCLEELLAAPTE